MIRDKEWALAIIRYCFRYLPETEYDAYLEAVDILTDRKSKTVEPIPFDPIPSDLGWVTAGSENFVHRLFGED